MTFTQELDKRLRRIDFDHKILFLQHRSALLVEFAGLKRYDNPISREGFAHELAILAHRSIIAGEGYISDSISNSYHKLVNLVREQQYFHEIASELNSPLEALPSIMYTQLVYQRNFFLLYFRYRYLLNYVSAELNVPNLILKKLGIQVSSIIDFSQLFLAMTSSAAGQKLSWENYHKIVQNIINVFPDIIEFLSLNRSDYQRKAEHLGSRFDIYSILDFNLLHQFPILQINKNYAIPFAPAIAFACTESVLYRLTEEDNPLRSDIGKYVLESYLQYLVNFNNHRWITEVIPEFEYAKRGNLLSHDLYILDDKQTLVAIELKFSSASLKLREFDKTVYKSTVTRQAEAITQCFNKCNLIHEGIITNEKFSKHQRLIGCVIVFDDFYIPKEKVFFEATQLIRKTYPDTSIEDVYNSIILLSLSNFEYLMLQTNDRFSKIFDESVIKRKQYDLFIHLDDSDASSKPKAFNDYMNRMQKLLPKYKDKIFNINN